eukprot:361449_1
MTAIPGHVRVVCPESECQNTTITCPTNSNKSSSNQHVQCTVECAEANACSNMRIVSPSNTNLTLLCHTSCSSITIDANNAKSVYFSCYHAKCSNITMNVNHAERVYLNCEMNAMESGAAGFGYIVCDGSCNVTSSLDSIDRMDPECYYDDVEDPSVSPVNIIAILVISAVVVIVIYIGICCWKKIEKDDIDFDVRMAQKNAPSEVISMQSNNHDERDNINQNENHAKIRNWLTTNVGLIKYFAHFIEHGYDSLDIIQEITVKDELIEIGIESVAHQEIFIRAIYELKNELHGGTKADSLANEEFIVRGDDDDDVTGGDLEVEYKKQYAIEWSTAEVLEWVIKLENGRYKTYVDKLCVGFNDEKVDGTNIGDVEEQDLRHYGVNLLSDRKALWKQFQDLVSAETYEPQLEGQPSIVRKT